MPYLVNKLKSNLIIHDYRHNGLVLPPLGWVMIPDSKVELAGIEDAVFRGWAEITDTEPTVPAEGVPKEVFDKLVEESQAQAYAERQAKIQQTVQEITAAEVRKASGKQVEPESEPEPAMEVVPSEATPKVRKSKEKGE